MFPKWFSDKWNKENPTNIFGPAIADRGALDGAVFGGGD